ncbi:unnamed protein product [Auanema sp. JU1783]|nr:unnamed protein product [Auanema sp. JU1783]
MTLTFNKALVEKAIPFLKCWKDVRDFKISGGATSQVVLFDGNSSNLETNKAITLEGEEISLAESLTEGKTVSQKFTMRWMSSENGLDKEIEFNGLTGGLRNQSGRPGVKFDSKNKSISINLLLCRSEGSFAIHSTNGEKMFMVVVPPNDQDKPDHERITVVPFTDGVKLRSGWWHSVPFPHPEKALLELEEFVVENVENEVLELPNVVGKPLQLTL